MSIPVHNKPGGLLPVRAAKKGFNGISAALSLITLALEIFSNGMIRISGEIYHLSA